MLNPRSWSSAARFSATLTFWAFCSILTLAYTLVIIAKLDVSFFEANGMIANEELRSAFYYQIFDVDSTNVLGVVFGLFAVAAVSYIFGRSQTNYFKRLGTILHTFANSGEAPVARNMGNFTPYLERWLGVMALRSKGEKPETVKAVMGSALKDWPSSPRMSWRDQIQFALGAAALASIFSLLCLTFFMKVNDRVVSLSYRLARFTSASGPQFLNQQISIVTFVAWTVLTIMCLAFVVTGYRYGRLMANSSYSCLRDLRRFMEGNSKQRLLLRAGDLGREHIPGVNKALDKIAAKL